MPYPTTIGGGLMSYASTVDTGQAQPLIFQAAAAEQGTATFAVTAGSAYFSIATLYAPITITQMRMGLTGSPTGNIDMGIYDSTGTNGQPNNLLAHTGANAAAAGIFTKSLTANLLLSPGIYWIAFLDTVADTIPGRTTSANGNGAMYKTTSTSLTVLPATAGAIATINATVQVYGLVSGGFS